MTLKNIGCFIKVAECGSFTQAAEQCYVTQPALSRAVQDLEREFGCELFSRNGQVLTLTKEGYACYRMGKKLLNDSEKMAWAMKNREDSSVLTIKIAYSFHLQIMYFSETLWELREKYPQVVFDVQREETDVIVRRLKEGEISLALLSYPVIEHVEGVRFVRFCPGEGYVMLHRDHPLSRRGEIYLKDLQNEKLVTFDSMDLQESSDYTKHLFEERMENFQAKIVNTIADMLVDVHLNHSIGIVSSCAQVLQSDRIVVLPIADYPSDAGPTVVWTPQMNTKETKFLDMVFKGSYQDIG